MRADGHRHPYSSVLSGIILSSETLGTGVRAHQRVSIGHEGGVVEAMSLEDRGVADALTESLSARLITLARLDGGDGVPLLVGLRDDPFSDGVTHLPESICPRQGVVLGVKSLIHAIQTAPLKTFVTNVFQRRDVHRNFWTMPAAARHHHVFPGGLATHSLEVAEDLAGHRGLTDLELDLGIAGALLHDIGKVWSYTEDMFPNSAGLAMGHELTGLSRIEPQLSGLEDVWPDGAFAMRALLSGQARMRENGSLPSALLPRIRACDQRSCERDRATRGRRAPSSRTSWTPAAWMDR